jgi:protein-tyrosine kinase
MLIPRASHLVERVAERLLRSGSLDDSAAQLLRSPGGEPAPDAAADVEAGMAGQASSILAPRLVAAPAQRSSLFASAPQLPATVTPSSDAPTASPLSNGRSQAPIAGPDVSLGRLGLSSGNGAPPPQDDPPVSVAASLASPAILSQPPGSGQTAGQSAVLDRPMDFAGSVPPLDSRLGLADPAAGMLQGPMSIDAVSLERAGMVDWSRTRTRISEEFRLVQRQILRSAFGPGAEPGFSNLLLVTSARPGEGKSFMSTNLSGSIARQGDHHVLLVDADSKRDSICYSLGLAQARGLLDLAANPKLDPAPLIVRTPIERLSILPVGRERERSAELFSTKEMTRLIQSLGRRYADRLLILDAPPCLSTSDPAVLAQVVGQILFVVEADRTQRDEIEASLDLIQACPTITMVLNKQQISSRYTFGAYSSYYSS